MQTEERKVDWEQIKRCLAEIDHSSRDFLRQALLIGGAACWFYRHQLKKVNDPDFGVPALSVEQENIWLSRDIDWTGIFSEDAMLLLPHHVKEKDGRKYIAVEGVRFGFAQVGVTIDPEEALANAVIASITASGRVVEFQVADALTLYYEKCKLCIQRGNPNDTLHKALLHDYTAYELVTGAEQLISNPTMPLPVSKAILQLWLRTSNKAPEILQDSRLRTRLKPFVDKAPHHVIAHYLAN